MNPLEEKLREFLGVEGAVQLGPMVNNYDLIVCLQRCVHETPQNLELLRSHTVECLRDDAWAKRYDPHVKEFILYYWEPRDDHGKRREQFLKFVSDAPPRGLGTTVADLLKLLDGTAEYFTVVEYVGREPGNPTGANQYASAPAIGGNRNNVTDSSLPRKGGNSTTYAVARLSRERPDLLEDVKAKRKTVHKAMIEAGFRKVPTPLEAITKLLPKLSADEKRSLLDLLTRETQP